MRTLFLRSEVNDEVSIIFRVIYCKRLRNELYYRRGKDEVSGTAALKVFDLESFICYKIGSVKNK